MTKHSKKGGKQPADEHAPRWLEIPDLNEEKVGAVTRHRGATSTRGREKKKAVAKKRPKSLKPRHSQPPFGANALHVNRGRGELETRRTVIVRERKSPCTHALPSSWPKFPVIKAQAANR